MLHFIPGFYLLLFFFMGGEEALKNNFIGHLAVQGGGMCPYHVRGILTMLKVKYASMPNII